MGKQESENHKDAEKLLEKAVEVATKYIEKNKGIAEFESVD